MFMERRLERRMELLEIDEQRLATRTAVAALAAIALAFAGIVGATTVVRAEESVAVQALATAPLPLSVVVGAWAYRLRRRLGELRGPKAEARSALEARAGEDPLADPAPPVTVSPADLIAIERILRTFYEAPSGAPADKQWNRFRALFVPGALVETGRGGPSDPGLPIEGCVALARVEARDVWLREIERTLHVLGDVAVALSSFEAYEPDSPDPSRGVNVVRLRKARGAMSRNVVKSDRGYIVDVVGAWRTDRLLLTEQDAARLRAALARATFESMASGETHAENALELLATALRSAIVVPPDRVPADVVTMRSRLVLAARPVRGRPRRMAASERPHGDPEGRVGAVPARGRGGVPPVRALWNPATRPCVFAHDAPHSNEEPPRPTVARDRRSRGRGTPRGHGRTWIPAGSEQTPMGGTR